MEFFDKNTIKITENVATAAAADDHNVVPRPNMHNGHKLYEVNLKEGILDEVVYEKKIVYSRIKGNVMAGSQKEVYRMKPHCIYYPALNETTALKKLVKMQSKRGITTKEIIE